MKINKTRAVVFFLLLTSDIVSIIASLYAAYVSRFYSAIVAIVPVTKGLPDWQFYFRLLYFIVPFWFLIFYQHKLYKAFFLPPIDDLIRVFRAVSLSIIFSVLAIFFYREFSYSRAVFALFWIYAVMVVFAGRQLVRYFVKYSFRSIFDREGILIVGSENTMIKSILKQYHYKKCFFCPNDDESGIENIKTMCREKRINEVILTNYQWSQNILLSFYD